MTVKESPSKHRSHPTSEGNSDSADEIGNAWKKANKLAKNVGIINKLRLYHP